MTVKTLPPGVKPNIAPELLVSPTDQIMKSVREIWKGAVGAYAERFMLGLFSAALEDLDRMEFVYSGVNDGLLPVDCAPSGHEWRQLDVVVVLPVRFIVGGKTDYDCREVDEQVFSLQRKQILWSFLDRSADDSILLRKSGKPMVSRWEVPFLDRVMVVNEWSTEVSFWIKKRVWCAIIEYLKGSEELVRALRSGQASPAMMSD